MKTCNLLAGLLLFASPTFAASTYEANLERSFQVSSGGKLSIQADRGSINVATDAGDTVLIKVFREVKGGTKAQADELFADHEVRFGQEGKTVSLVAKSKDNKIWSRIRSSFQVRYEVSVPKQFSVDLNTAGGDIIVGDLHGEAVARTSSGRIKLAKVTGKVEVSNAGGDIMIAEAGEKLIAHTSSGSIIVEQAKANVEASNSGGDIRIEAAGGDARAATSSGQITLGRIVGDVDARNAGGDIKVSSAGGKVEAQTSSGSIQIDVAQGKSVIARNSGGDIEIGEAAGSVSAETSSGSIRIKTAKGRVEAKDSGGDIQAGEVESLFAQTSSGSIKVKVVKGNAEAKNSGGDIKLGEVGGTASVRISSGSIVLARTKGKVEARNSGGNIEIAEAGDIVLAETSSGDLVAGFSAFPKGDCRLSVSGGGIKVLLPKGAGVDVDARASGGRVIADMPVTMAVRGDARQGVVQGKINGGGPALVLRSSSGDIHLKESAGVAISAEKEDK